MNILHFVGDRRLPTDPDAEPTSGVVRAVVEIARAQVRLGHRVEVASVAARAQSWSWQKVQFRNLAAAHWATLRIGRHRVDFRQHAPLVIHAAARLKPYDVVHTHLYSYLRFVRARQRVLHFHTDPFHASGEHSPNARSFSIMRRYSDAQIAVSRFVAQRATDALRLETPVDVVYNGASLGGVPDGFSRVAERERRRAELGVQANETVFLFAGAMTPEKGLETLLAAFKLASAVPGASVRLLIAGSRTLWGGTIDESDQVHEAHVRGEACQGEVFLGALAPAELRRTYIAADAVVVPSVWNEALSLSAVDAVRLGIPVIASRIGGLPEVVEQGVGVLVPPGDTEALAAAMVDVTRKIGQDHWPARGSSTVVSDFDWMHAAERIDAIYARLNSAADTLGVS